MASKALAAVASVLLIGTVAASQTITGYIYCDNTFEFYFNGALVASDPMSFKPHQAVKVSFTWDGVSDKHYAIICQDFATSSGYEYTETSNPQLGDGALLARFDDGTATNSDWTTFVVSEGPTEASVSAGCSSSNLGACVVDTVAEPSGWKMGTSSGATWTRATQYSEDDAGWGSSPNWSGSACCTSASPLTRNDLTLNNGCSVNYSPSAPTAGVAVSVTSDQCLDPKDVLDTDTSAFIWTDKLETDNKVLFYLKRLANDTTTMGPNSLAPRGAAVAWVATLAVVGFVMALLGQ